LARALVQRPAVVFAALAFGLSCQFLVLGPYSVVPIYDYADSCLAAMHALKSNLNTYGLTYWFPNAAAGVDRLTAQDYSYAYVPILLGLALPIWLAMGLSIWLGYFLAMYFTFRLFTTDLQLNVGISAVAAVVFATYSEFNFMLLGLYAFPLTLYAFHRAADRSHWRLQLLLIVGLAGLTAALSSVVYLPYTLPIVAVWFFYVIKTRNKGLWWLYVTYCAVVVVCEAPSLAAFTLNAVGSHRDFLTRGFKTATPGFYVAVATDGARWAAPTLVHVVLLACGLYWSRLRDRRFNAAAVCLLLTTLGATSLDLLRDSFGLQMFSYPFSRFFLVSPLFYSVCIAYALTHAPVTPLRFGRGRWNWLSGRTVATVSIVALLAVHATMAKVADLKYWIRNGSYSAIFQSPQMQRIATRSKVEPPFRVATVASLILPGYAMAYGLEAADGYLNLYPMRYKQFWSQVVRPLADKNDSVNVEFNLWGSRFYLFSPTKTPTETIVFRDAYNLDLLSLVNTKYIISRSRLLDPALRIIEQPDREFYQLSRSEQVRLRVHENFNGNSSLFVYENTLALPRVFMPQEVRVFSTTDQLLRALGEANTETLRHTAFVEQRDAAHLEVDGTVLHPGTATLTTYSPDEVRVRVNAHGKALLVVSNSMNPFWKVQIDGRGAPMIPTYHAFWGVPVREGDSEVRFYYDPPYRLATLRTLQSGARDGT
jgi:hypothetical protein